jgi:hypothetical protein
VKPADLDKSLKMFDLMKPAKFMMVWLNQDKLQELRLRQKLLLN